jgi:hypothetical protein
MSIRIPNIRPNLRRFPGQAPRLNTTHPAYNKVRLAAVTTGNGCIDLLRGISATLSSGVVLKATAFGPGVSGTDTGVSYPQLLPETLTSTTWATIFVAADETGNRALISAFNTVDNALNINGLTPILEINGSAVALTPALPALVVGHAYFFAASLKATAPKNQVVLSDLTTGQVFFSTGSVSFSLAAGLYAAPVGILSSSLNAAFISASSLTQQQLIQWAQDPWSLWYDPSTRNVAALARRVAPAPTNVTATFATTEARDVAHFIALDTNLARLATTEARDVAHFVALDTNLARLATTEARDVAHFVATTNVLATLATTEARDVAHFVVSNQTVTATLATTEARDTAHFVALDNNLARLATTEARDVAHFFAATTNVANLATTEARDVAHFVVSNVNSARLVTTEARDVAQFNVENSPPITATLATTEARDVAHFAVDNTTNTRARLKTTEAPDIANFNVFNFALPQPPPPPFATGPTTQTVALPAYPYKEYDDDPFTVPFFTAYNQVAQDYVDTVNALNLPIYTGANINGLLLDWVGGGIYGFPRPTIGGASTPGVGTLNTWELNTLTLNSLTIGTAGIAQTASDDIYKRCLTWHIFKGEGRYFTVKSLKRRVMRFLLGTNGSAPNIDQTYQISVSFGPNHEVTIRFINNLIKTLKSAQLNTFTLNSTLLNSSVNQIIPLVPLPFQQVFQDAVLSGALELPFQYTWEVVITS